MSTRPFDTAAQEYDTARGFPPGVGEQVAEAALTWIGGGARVLEVGIGTGRIARPLTALGAQVTGVDLSPGMMRRLRESLPPGEPAPALVQGDLEHLPLAAHRFDAVVAVHVFQLIPDWVGALAEVRRMLRPGGIFLNGYEWRPPDSPGARLAKQWRAILQAAGGPSLAGAARDFDDLKTELAYLGAACEERSVGQWATTRTVARHLETIEHRTWTPAAGLPRNAYADCLAALRAWAFGQLGAPDREYNVPHRFVWQRFTWQESQPSQP